MIQTDAKEKCVLIVDDDVNIRTNIVTLMREEGWRTVEGEDGEEAFALAVVELPDLIILDVLMPGKSGFDALKELREDERTENIPVIMLTAVNDENLGNCYDAETVGIHVGVLPPEDFVEKPFSAARVLEAVRRVMIGKEAVN